MDICVQGIDILPLEKQKILGAYPSMCHCVEPLGVQLCGKVIFLPSQGW